MPSQRRMLKSPYPSVRVQTVHQLSSRPNPRRLKPLIALLTDTDAGVRQAAAEALGKLGDPRAVQPLIAALTDTNARVVARALGELGDRRAVQPLIALLTDTHAGVGVRQEAAEALGKLGDPRAVQPLAAALTDTDMRVCNAAARMLGELGWQPENDRQRATLAITLGRWDEAVRFGPAAVEPLITALASGWNPRAAAQALGKLGDPQPLITALTDTDSGVRREAAIALGKLGDPRAARPLITALADTDSGVRETAAAALEKFGDAAVQPLAAALTDTEPAVRKAVARKLGELGWQPENDRQRAALAITLGRWDEAVRFGPAAVEPLITALTDTDKDVRAAAADALGQLGDALTADLVIPLLGNVHADVRQRAADWLGKIGDPRAVRPLIAAFEDADYSTSAAVMHVLTGTFGDALTADLVIPLLGNVKVQEEAAGWLGKIGDPRAVQPLIAALHDPESLALSHQTMGLRQAAAHALGQLGDPRAVQPLIAALGERDRYVRQAAAHALGQLGDPQAVQPLIATLTDTEVGVRREAVTTLGQLGDPQAVQPLITALQDQSPDVRGQAARSLSELGWHPEDNSQQARLMAASGRWAEAARLGPAAVEPLIAAVPAKAPPTLAGPLVAALRSILETSLPDIDAHSLRQLATLHDVQWRLPITDSYGCTYDTKNDGTSCAQVRQLARQELIRRGLADA